MPGRNQKKMIEWWGDSIWEYYAATEAAARMSVRPSG